MQKISQYFLNDLQFLKRTIWFKRALYTLIIINCFYYLGHYDLLFGANSIVYINPAKIGFIKNIPFLLYHSAGEYTAFWFIGFLLTLTFFNLLLPRLYFIPDVLIWLLVLNLHNRVYPALSGGNYFLNQLLFFNCFLAGSHRFQNNRFIKPFHNTAVVGVITQVCVIYLISGLTKLFDPAWRSGEAIGSILRLDYFKLGAIDLYFPFLEPLYLVTGYLVMSYQLLFPAFVWIRPFKKPFLVLGLLIHLYITFVMGLVTFGIVMMTCYIYFWPRKATVQ